jgi:formylmethanofuran dehydrogenase subunit E
MKKKTGVGKVDKVNKEPKYINNLKKKSKKREVVKKGMVYKKRDRGNFEGVEIVIPKSVRFCGYCFECESMVIDNDVVSDGKFICVGCGKIGKVEKLLKNIEISKESLDVFKDEVIPIDIPKEIEDVVKEE